MSNAGYMKTVGYYVWRYVAHSLNSTFCSLCAYIYMIC